MKQGNRYTYTYVKGYVESQGYILHSTEYNGANAKIEVECPKNHIYLVAWAAFHVTGHRCSRCRGNHKYSYEEIKSKLKNLGYTLLSENYRNNRQALKIECKHGHVNHRSLGDIRRYPNCEQCAGRNIYTYEEVKQYIEQNSNYTLVSKSYIFFTHKLDIRCDRGHEYQASFSKFKDRGQRCPFCNKPRVTLERVTELAESLDYELLSTEYISDRKKLLFRCDKGHIFKKSWGDLNSGRHCQYCSKTGFKPGQPGSLYYARLESDIGTFYKLGICNTTIADRLSRVPYKTTLLWHKVYLFGKYAAEEEKRLFKLHSSDRYTKDELGKFGGHTELFTKDILLQDSI